MLASRVAHASAKGRS